MCSVFKTKKRLRMSHVTLSSPNRKYLENLFRYREVSVKMMGSSLS